MGKYRNIGRRERRTRIVGGLVLLLVGVFAPIPLLAGELVDVLGILLVVTGGVGYCPVWHALNRNTYERGSHEDGRTRREQV